MYNDFRKIMEFYDEGYLDIVVKIVNENNNPYNESYLKTWTSEELRDKLLSLCQYEHNKSIRGR